MADSKAALVTGAGQGIGRAIALKLAADGFDVAVADLGFQEEKARAVVKEVEELGRRAIWVAADVSKRDEVFAAVDATAEQLGSFDVIANNAGIVQVEPVDKITTDNLEKIFSINVYSVIYGIQAASAKFEELGKDKGKIISAGSIAGARGFPILGAYSATKFAVRGITQVAAQELAPRNITVNSWAPGIVGTGMWDTIDEEMGKLNGKAKGENLKDNVEGIALGRIETPEDVAGVVSFFASDNADYVTGQTLLVDGGMLYN
jgi:meso-butanediol dehydrogenase/(S,S)-butanediol dehydrogenase/diacetyl reductase